jgi:large subunit ribosomal protein L22
MPGPKTNERQGTRAVLRHARVSPYKVREVLDLVRNKPVAEAEDILRFTERDAGILVGKVLHSAVANAGHNDQQDPEELYVSACFADEGTTIKRWRPRARGRATRIRKRTCHITVIVSRLPDADLIRLHAKREAEQAARRARRVAGARKADAAAPGGGGRGLRTRVRPQRRRAEGAHDHDHDHDHDPELLATTPSPEPVEVETEAVTSEPVADEPVVDEPVADEPEAAAEAAPAKPAEETEKGE